MANPDRSTRASASGSDGGPTPSSLDPAGAPTPDLPPTVGLPAGLRIRRYAGPADHPGMVEAGNAWRTAMGFLELDTVDLIDVQYANMANSDPATDCFVAERDGTIAGYARTEWHDGRDGERRYGIILIVAPDPDRRTLVDALFDLAERRSGEVAAGHETDRRRVLDAFAPGRDDVLIEATERRGYSVVRRGYEMVRPDLDAIPEVPLPAGLEVRPVRSQQLRAIWDADVEAFRDHFGGSDASEEAWKRFRLDPLADPTLWRIAWDGDQVAGQVRSYIDAKTNQRTGRLTGWTEFISVRRPWRRRGLARALLADSLRAVRDRGMTEAALGVDARNETGALALYESLGFVVHRTELILERPLPGYGGADTARADEGRPGDPPPGSRDAAPDGAADR